MKKQNWDEILKQGKGRPKITKKPRKQRGMIDGLNKKFHEEEIQLLMITGDITFCIYEGIKLLAIRGGIDTRDTWYTPDFFIIQKGRSRPVIYEVKGYWRQKDRKRTMAAAEKFRGVFDIYGAQHINGAWEYERF